MKLSRKQRKQQKTGDSPFANETNSPVKEVEQIKENPALTNKKITVKRDMVMILVSTLVIVAIFVALSIANKKYGILENWGDKLITKLNIQL